MKTKKRDRYPNRTRTRTRTRRKKSTKKSTKARNKMDLLVTTSPIKEFDFIEKAIESVQHQKFRKKYILFDYPKDKSKLPTYKKYIQEVRNKYEKDGFTLLVSQEHRHFREGVKWAITSYVKSDWIFLIQHDVTIPQSINLQELMRDKPKDADIIYIPPPGQGSSKKNPALPWKPRSKDWFRKTEVVNADWVKTWGWSERVFMFDRKWMIKMLETEYKSGRRRFFIEEVVYSAMKGKKWPSSAGEIWKDWKTYAYRNAIHTHLVGHGL